jgi:hypothetical protein
MTMQLNYALPQTRPLRSGRNSRILSAESLSLGRKRHYAPCNYQSVLNLVLCLLLFSLAGCAHKPPSYKEAMLGEDQIWIAQGVLDSYKERALDLFAYPEGIDLAGYIRSLKPDTNHPVTFGFTEDGGGRVIVRVPARLTNGTPARHGGVAVRLREFDDWAFSIVVHHSKREMSMTCGFIQPGVTKGISKLAWSGAKGRERSV